MKRPLYVSTGCLVGRVNGYDLDGSLGIIKSLFADGFCRGLELMMLAAYGVVYATRRRRAVSAKAAQ